MNNMQRLEDAIKALRTAKDWTVSDFVVLDTETTGRETDSAVVQVGIIDCFGHELVNTLVNPLVPIPPGATSVHNITDSMVKGAPTFSDVYSELCSFLTDRTVLIYNADYDSQILQNACRRHNLHPFVWKSTPCVMLNYAQFAGVWNAYRNSYRWHKLTDAASQCGIAIDSAHDALADTRMTLELVRWMGARFDNVFNWVWGDE